MLVQGTKPTDCRKYAQRYHGQPARRLMKNAIDGWPTRWRNSLPEQAFCSNECPPHIRCGPMTHKPQFQRTDRGGFNDSGRRSGRPLALAAEPRVSTGTAWVMPGPARPSRQQHRAAVSYGSSTVLPVVLRASKSRCACCTWARGRRWSIRILTWPPSTTPNNSSAMAWVLSRVAM